MIKTWNSFVNKVTIILITDFIYTFFDGLR